MWSAGTGTGTAVIGGVLCGVGATLWLFAHAGRAPGTASGPPPVTTPIRSAPASAPRTMPPTLRPGAVVLPPRITQPGTPEAPRGRIVGRVVDERGDPIPGAEVHVQPFLARWDVVVSARTADDGTFSAEVEAPAVWDLRAGAPGWQTTTRQAVQVLAGGETRTELRLARAAVLEGRVVTADGAPVADALVRTHDGATDAAATTGADGRFRFDRIHPGSHAVWIQATGFRPLDAVLQTGAGSAELRLVRGARLQVTIDGAGDAPVSVWLRSSRSDGSIWAVGTTWLGNPTPLGDGRAVLDADGLPAGAYEVRASSPDGEGDWVAVRLVENEEAHAEIRLVPPEPSGALALAHGDADADDAPLGDEEAHMDEGFPATPERFVPEFSAQLSDTGELVVVVDLALMEALLPGDRILSVDGTGIAPGAEWEILDALAGEEGTPATLEVLRPASGERFRVERTRTMPEPEAEGC